MRIRSLAAAGALVALTLAAAAPALAQTKATTKKTTKATTKATTKPTTPATAPATTKPAVATASSATVEALRKKGKIVIGVKYDVPAFGLQNAVTGNIEGFDVEVGNIIARAIFGPDIKGKVEFVEAISANRQPFIIDGKVDLVISTYTINDARKREVDFAGPYYVAKQDILIYKVDAGSITSVESLNGRKVCSVQGSTSLRNLQALAPRASVTAFRTYSECVEALKDGRVDAVTTDDSILAGFAARFPAFQLVENPFSDEPYGIGLKRCDNDFRAFINDTLDKSAASGEFKKAWEATLGAIGLKFKVLPKLDRYTAQGC